MNELKAELFQLAQFKRSDEWRRLEQRYKRTHKLCVVCGARKRLDVHHIKPYWLYPELELDETNLATMCKAHHLLIGHLNHWTSYDPAFWMDVATWKHKIENRPRPKRPKITGA